jgi:trans-aconitate methyltransferase
VSRLDSHIRQKIAQRDAIDLAARWLGDRPGPIVEFGLGTGRSYSHLVERFPDREVFCFDRRDVAHPRSRPPADRFYVGELAAVLADPALHARFAARVILLHLDLGSGGPEDETVPELVVQRTHGWLAPGGVVLSDQDLTLAAAWRLTPVDTRGQVQHADRYHIYRRDV